MPTLIPRLLHDASLMKLIFIDESGYSTNWLNDIEQQPFHVLSAVAIDASVYAEACKEVRERVDEMNLPGLDHPLGKGSEIKARFIMTGGGWWRANNDARTSYRNLMLEFPRRYGGAAFLVVIDKAKHRDRYAKPLDPAEISMTYLFERIEFYLRGVEADAYCIYDHNTWRTNQLLQQAVGLIREGSTIQFHSSFWDQEVVSKHLLDHIVEMALCVSHNSIGLQVADFFATCGYRYFRDSPQSCGWWNTLRESLYSEAGEVNGCGLKEFP